MNSPRGFHSMWRLRALIMFTTLRCSPLEPILHCCLVAGADEQGVEVVDLFQGSQYFLATWGKRMR